MPIGVTVKHLPSSALLALALLVAAPLAACVPEGSAPDGHVAAPLPVEEQAVGLEVEFVWPDSRSRITDEGVVVDLPFELPIRVRLLNRGPAPVRVVLDDLLMRPVVEPGDPEGDVEAVYPAPAPLRLDVGQSRALDFGQVSLFFGFACTVHLTGEVQALQGPDETVAISHDSRPILLDF